MKHKYIILNILILSLLSACGNFPDPDPSCNGGGCQFRRTPAGFPTK
jgi:hypothetical protein